MPENRISALIGKLIGYMMTARIDIKNSGAKENDIVLQACEYNATVSRPAWLQSISGQGSGIVLESTARELHLNVDCIGSGNLKIWLHACNVSVSETDGKRLPVWVDYTYFKICESVIFDTVTPTWHDSSFYIEKKVEDGERISMDIRWQPHAYIGDEIQDIINAFIANEFMKLQNENWKTLVINTAMECHFSVLGTCVPRDSLVKIEEMVGCKFYVDRFVQDVNPISLHYGSPVKNDLLTETALSKCIKDPTQHRFKTRNTLLDINKHVFPYMFEVKSNYLILDTGCLRLDVRLNRKKHLGITAFNFNQIQETSIPDWKEYELYKSTEFDESMITFCMKEYLESVLEKYDESEIILFEIYNVKFYIDKSRNYIKPFPQEVLSENRAISLGYSYIKDCLLHCHVVPFPLGVLGDESHKWGRYPLHYVKEYYEYAGKALKVIMERNDLKTEKNKIQELKDECEKCMMIKYLNLGTL